MSRNDLSAWAARWNVSTEALEELRTIFTAPAPDLAPRADLRNEAAVQATTRIEASAVGGRLWRNNVGAVRTDTGSFLRFGLANDSARMNADVKSSDLIGVCPVRIMPEHVGETFGRFVARETKRPGWRYRGTPRERAQLRFIQLVAGLGGDACFCVAPGTLKHYIRN